MDKSNVFFYFAGIDVSKNHLDIAVLNQQSKVLMALRFENSPKGWRNCIKEMKANELAPENTLFCLEKTGNYSNPSVDFLHSKNLFAWQEMPIRIKRTQGFTRGKSDTVDAIRIASYGLKNQIDAVKFEPTRAQLKNLKNLYAMREKLSKTKNQYESQIAENKFINDEVSRKILKDISKKTIAFIKNEIENIERLIRELIASDKELKRLYTIITSVDGAGFVTAVSMIVYSNEFKSVDTAKKYACYAGIAPFENSSGLKTYNSNKVSHFANKDAKRVLHLAAMSAIYMNGEYKEYYHRKISQGKPKMLILNTIRNKIIQRVYACVKRNELFERRVLNEAA